MTDLSMQQKKKKKKKKRNPPGTNSQPFASVYQTDKQSYREKSPRTGEISQLRSLLLDEEKGCDVSVGILPSNTFFLHLFHSFII